LKDVTMILFFLEDDVHCSIIYLALRPYSSFFRKNAFCKQF
jgi:hypothetical protein